MEVDMSSSSSWSPDSSISAQRSLWLQTTLSEMDKKMKAMMSLLEEENSSSKIVEIQCTRKSELTQMLEEFNMSYRSLAEQHDQLRCKSHYALHSGSLSSSSNSRAIRTTSDNQKGVAESFTDPKLAALDSPSDSIIEDPDAECDLHNFDFDIAYLNRLADELLSTEQCKMNLETKSIIEDNDMDKGTAESSNKEDIKMNGSELGPATTRDFAADSSRWENTWPEIKIQVTKLMVENLRQKAELLKRNERKRKTINGLRAEIERLKSENRALQNCTKFSKVVMKRSQSHVSRSNESIFSIEKSPAIATEAQTILEIMESL
ncbi:protein NETWORKED 3A-like [Mangifera indica]|uniref:protein NETWORKED 3A-like n=1 Tax=Mangifera indica TaxID=29780 RepID=UPI001CF9562D|nr:protein NETWORKED 3A-like [Mangifera indica]XP_044465812.1 protein NETWORKED 3A-like [Mangifera indica]